ncbi:MAG: hypothetical protein AAF495_26650 [Pseudomonadota bacterium]
MSRGGISDPSNELAALAGARRAAVRVLAATKIGGPTYRAAERLLDAIDDVAGALTGDREVLWSRAPSTFGPGPES